MAKLLANVHIKNAEGTFVVLEAGKEAPKWAADKLGKDHPAFAKAEPEKAQAPQGAPQTAKVEG